MTPAHRVIATVLLAVTLLLVAAAATAAPACPHASFDDFLARFGRDAGFQRGASADPLDYGYLDVGGDDPEPVHQQRPLASLQWPLFPDPAGFGQTRSLRITDTGDGQRQVVVRREGSSDQQVYRFRQEPCWTLVGMFDESI
ncbi:hypothetical protein [Xanthomonas sp. XNM01]|uniref:hypothetical protein n=1 Tax=Xanthomonas sp. XNM01 TaxID=2769289 RepID=UPI001781B98B|nr:hypothetical protein [Xanthomonas sp. XNM01]MBD9369632.1 hypothetical protein [Xanthomonas sp. XNM01]